MLSLQIFFAKNTFKLKKLNISIMIKNLFHNSTLMQEFKKEVLHFSATLFVCLLLFTTMMPSKLSAQVVKPFTQRTSQYSPEQTIYHIQGDFALIGNTNMTLKNYSNTEIVLLR